MHPSNNEKYDKKIDEVLVSLENLILDVLLTTIKRINTFYSPGQYPRTYNSSLDEKPPLY